MDPATREMLADLLLKWEDAFRAGHDLSAAELARDTPALIEPLGRRIRVLKATFWLDHPEEPPDTTSDAPPPGGRMLAGRYRLDERIAVGGFAEVWRAFDIELQRTVAVKIPKPSRIGMREVFLAEARRVAKLRHPGIVPVYDVGTDGDTCFIVSEFMDGGSLADRLARGPLEPAVATRWIAQIADALASAHRSDVIHRDIKPANILLNHHGDAVLADFGIAQSAAACGEFTPSVGTLRYMAPEQLTAGAAGPASDIYSLGIVLHEALTGRTPHAGDAPAAILEEITGTRDLPVSPALPPRIAPVCSRALRRQPAERYPTAAAFAGDLKRIAAGTNRGWFALGVAIAVVAGLIPLVTWGRRPAPQKPRLSQPKVDLVLPAVRPAPPLDAAAGSRAAAVMFRRIAEANPYVVACQDVVHYSGWENPPDTYLAPLPNDTACIVTYRFDFARPISSVRLVARTSCWDFTREPGGFGRGASAVEVSRDGTDWVTIRDSLHGPAWGEDWDIDESLPAVVLGGTSIWIRARLITNGSPNSTYSVAQFGRNRDDPAQPTFGIAAELEADGSDEAGPR
jgi:hypothetical protein